MRAIIGAILLLNAGAAPGEHGHGLPHVSMRMQHGQTLQLKEWNGRVVVVNFWATWCKPCRSEIPDLQRLDSDFSALVRVVGIAVDAQGWRTVMPFLRGQAVTFPVALLTREMRSALGTRTASLPQTFVFDGKGRLVARFTEALEERDVLRIVQFAKTATGQTAMSSARNSR